MPSRWLLLVFRCHAPWWTRMSSATDWDALEQNMWPAHMGRDTTKLRPSMSSSFCNSEVPVESLPGRIPVQRTGRERDRRWIEQARTHSRTCSRSQISHYLGRWCVKRTNRNQHGGQEETSSARSDAAVFPMILFSSIRNHGYLCLNYMYCPIAADVAIEHGVRNSAHYISKLQPSSDDISHK
jgi:hypothetical protein